MSQCNTLSFTIMTQYYRKNWEGLCCWLPPEQTYNEFVTGITQTYNESCLKDRVFSDYVTRLFNECLTGSSSDGIYVTGGTANGTDDTLVFTNNSGGTFTVANSALLFNDAYVSGGTLDSATGCVTFVNTSGGTFQVCGFDGFTSYWSANTYGDITTSGGTDVFLSAGTGTTYPLTIERDTVGHFLKLRDNSNIQQDYTFESENTGTFYGLNLKNKDGDTIVNFAANQMLGVGTIDPTVAIDVASSLQAADALQVRLSGKAGLGHTNAGQTRTIIGNSYKHDQTRFGVTMGGYTTGDELLTIMGTGDVGVGTGDETIRARLHVSGTTILTDNLSVSGNSALVGILGVTGKTYLGDVAAAGASYTNNEILVRSATAAVEYLTIAQLKEDIADSDLWSANTFGIINSGLTAHVGIGTATPNKPLTVVGDISGTTALYLGNSGTTFISGETITGPDLSLHSGDDIELYAGDDIVLNATEKIKITQFNAAQPSLQIDLNDNAGTAFFQNGDNDTVIAIDDGDQRLYFYDIGGEYIVSDGTDLTISSGADILLDPTSNVGIGTTTPNKKLTVDGSISASTDLYVSGDTALAGIVGITGKTYLGTVAAAGASYTNNEILVRSSTAAVEYLTIAQLKEDIADADLWTANTYGIINSGLTAHVGIGTNTPNKPLTVLGDISGTTAIYLGDPEGGIFISGETQADGDLSLHSNDDIEYYCGDDMVFNVACKIKFTELTGITPSLQLELDGSGNGHGVCFIENGLDNHILAISTADTRLYFVDVGGEWISGDTTDLSIGSGNDIKLMPTTAVLIDTDKPIRWRDSGLAILSSTDGQLDIDADGELEITSPIVDIDASTGLDLAGANLNSTWTVNTTNKIQFRDSGLYIHSSADGQLDIVTDTALLLTSPYVGVGNAATGPGEIRFYEDTDDGAHYAALKTGALGASYTLTLPTDDGDSGEVLSTDGNGVLSWAAAGGGGTSYWTANTYGIANSGLTTTKVGIGTATPSALFEVKDLIKFPEVGSVFIGDNAGVNWESNSTSNTAVGRLAMGTGTMSTALGNTAIGFAAFAAVTTGDYNTAVGLQSLSASNTGAWNAAFGKTAMYGTTYHSYNTGIGANALYFTTSGDLGKTVLTDTHNTAIGYSSQYYSINGAYNTSVGSQSIGNGSVTVAGTGNTAMGYESLFNSQTGSWNVALGYQAGDNITTGDKNICIGPNADPPSATADYQMNIGGIIHGQDAYSDSAISQVGIGTTAPKVKLDVHHNPTDLVDNTGGGEVVTFGTEHGTDVLGPGKLMYLNTSGVWRYADADVSKGNDELLAIALGTTVAEGLLIRGFFDLVAELSGSFVKGGVCYVGTPQGQIQFTQPSGSGDFVRVVGYGTDTANVIYFNPDGTYITVA